MGFTDLLSVIELMFTMAPVFLGITIIILIMKMIEISLKDMMIIPILFIGSLMILSNIPLGEAEPIDYQPNKKFFSYMDLCNKYITFNASEETLIPDLDSDHYEIIVSDDINYYGVYKPSKTILWNESYDTDSLNLITQYVYNLTDNNELEIRFYYENFVDLNISQEITFYYSEYLNDQSADNLTTQYKYIDVQSPAWNDTSDSQSIYTRTSNLFNNNQHVNVYNEYHKQLKTTTTTTAVNAQNLTVTFTRTIKNRQFNTIRIKPATLVRGNNVLFSHEFINFGMTKNNKNDTVVLDVLKIRDIDESTDIPISPFLEYYEFHNIPSIYNDGLNAEHELFSVDLVENDYNNLYAHEFRVYLKQGGNDLNNHYLVIEFDGSTVTTIIGNLEPGVLGDINNFIGYQVYIQYAVNPNNLEGFYTVYLHYKWSENTLEAPGSLVTNWTTRNIIIEDNNYLYLANLNIYNHTNTTDYERNFIQNSRKFDVVDKGITKINDAPGSTVQLTQDIDSGGLSIPGVGDLKKMLQNIVVGPISTVLNNLIAKIQVPIDALGDTLNAVSSTLSALSTQVSNLQSSIGSKIDLVNSLLGTISGTLSSMSTILSNTLAAISAFQSAVAGHITTITNALTDLKNGVLLAIADIETKIDSTISAIGTVITNLGIFFDLINDDFITPLSTLLTWLGTILPQIVPFLTSITTQIKDFFEGASDMITLFFDVTFSLVGVVFSYLIVFKSMKFFETEDIMDLWGIVEVFYLIAQFFISLIDMIIPW